MLISIALNLVALYVIGSAIVFLVFFCFVFFCPMYGPAVKSETREMTLEEKQRQQDENWEKRHEQRH